MVALVDECVEFRCVVERGQAGWMVSIYILDMMDTSSQRVMRITHHCASILDSIAKGISLFPRFFAWS